MVPKLFLERFEQMMRVKNAELASQKGEELSRRSADAARRGQLSPDHLPHLRHETTVWLIKQRIEGAIEAIKRLLPAHELPYSEDLVTELKALLGSQVSEIWCRQAVDAYGHVDEQRRISYDRDLLHERGVAFNKANTEIDILVDGIRTHATMGRTQPKQLEQKFGILLSPNQAKIDFDGWKESLGPIESSIAIFFVDIDNFKKLNTAHTETIIDQTILPATMRLISNLAVLRGGAYRHGGEEFLMILPNCDGSEATMFAEKVRSVFESTEFPVKDQVERLTGSIGITIWHQHGSSFEEVLQTANMAESQAKLSRNKCVFANC